MKHLTFLFLFFLFVGCNLDDATKKEIMAKQKALHDEITGKWTMCHPIHNNGSINYNVCPTFHFFTNGGGVENESLLGEDHFHWELKENSISLSPLSTLDEKIYVVNYRKTEDEEYLDLENKKDSTTYFLIRTSTLQKSTKD